MLRERGLREEVLATSHEAAPILPAFPAPSVNADEAELSRGLITRVMRQEDMLPELIPLNESPAVWPGAISPK